jgi:hypothetical protein
MSQGEKFRGRCVDDMVVSWPHIQLIESTAWGVAWFYRVPGWVAVGDVAKIQWLRVVGWQGAAAGGP